MQVIQSKPVENYSQTNGTIIRKSGRNKVVVQQEEDGEDEEEVVEQTIITKKTIRKKGGKKTYVRFGKFARVGMHWETLPLSQAVLRLL